MQHPTLIELLFCAPDAAAPFVQSALRAVCANDWRAASRAMFDAASFADNDEWRAQADAAAEAFARR